MSVPNASPSRPVGVRMLPSIGGQVRLVACSHSGEVLLEMSISPDLYNRAWPEWMERWLTEVDPETQRPQLRLHTDRDRRRE